MKRTMLQGCSRETVHHNRSSREVGRPSHNPATVDSREEDSGTETAEHRRGIVSLVDGEGYSASRESGAQIVEKALEISGKRRGYLDAMRKAIRDGNKDSVFELARKLTGLSNEECHRTNTRLN